MAVAVVTHVGAAARIVAAEALHAVFDTALTLLLLLRLVGDDGAEKQPAQQTGSGGAVIPITAAIAVSPVVMTRTATT